MGRNTSKKNFVPIRSKFRSLSITSQSINQKMPAKKIVAMFALAAQAQDAAPVVPGEGERIFSDSLNGVSVEDFMDAMTTDYSSSYIYKRSSQTIMITIFSPTMELTEMPEDQTTMPITLEKNWTPHNCLETIPIPSTLAHTLVKMVLTINADNVVVSILPLVEQPTHLRLVMTLKTRALFRSAVNDKVETLSTRSTPVAQLNRLVKLNLQRTSLVQLRTILSLFAINVVVKSFLDASTLHLCVLCAPSWVAQQLEVKIQSCSVVILQVSTSAVVQHQPGPAFLLIHTPHYPRISLPLTTGMTTTLENKK